MQIQYVNWTDFLGMGGGRGLNPTRVSLQPLLLHFVSLPKAPFATPPPKILSLVTPAVQPQRKFVHKVMNFHGLFMDVHENA